MIQKKITAFLFSTRLMAVLFIAYAVAMGIGTFLENDFGTAAARIWIYNAWWFEVIMGIKKRKITHSSFTLVFCSYSSRCSNYKVY